MSFQKACFFEWEPITTGNVILIFAVLVALFGPRIWKVVDDRRNRESLKAAINQLLESLKTDLIRIRDERNGDLEEGAKVQFSETSIGEISHYFYVFEDMVMPNLVLLKISKKSSVVGLFDSYRKNIEVCRSKGHLAINTVNILISKIEDSIGELSK